MHGHIYNKSLLDMAADGNPYPDNTEAGVGYFSAPRMGPLPSGIRRNIHDGGMVRRIVTTATTTDLCTTVPRVYEIPYLYQIRVMQCNVTPRGALPYICVGQPGVLKMVEAPEFYGPGTLNFTAADLVKWLHWPYDGSVPPLMGEPCDEVFTKNSQILHAWFRADPISMVCGSWMALHGGNELSKEKALTLARDYDLAVTALADGPTETV